MLHSASHNGHIGKVRKLAKSAGYKTGAQNHSVKKMIKTAIHAHEKHDHPGKPLTKLKDGGYAEGKHAHKRLDKMARGGPKKHSKVAVNIVMPQGEKQAVPMPMPAAGAPIAARPPMPQPAPMAPGAAPVGARPPGMKLGGKAPHMEAGAGSGLGRLEKASSEKKSLKGKKKGGEC